MNSNQHPGQSPDAPSSTEERGRGNSGEGKDPSEGLYPPSAENRPSSPDADSSGESRGSDKPTTDGPGQRKTAN
jgi:hypothetical protein